MFCDSLVSFTDHPVSQAVNFISTNLSEGKISFTGAPALFDVIALDWAGADQDTILAAYQEDSAKVFLDASFVRYMSDRVPLCDHLQLYCNILKWLEPSGCYCFDDCPPAYARVLCPLPDESYSSCITQGATFLVKDTTGLLIDTMRVYFTVTILNRHHGYDTLYSLHEPSADLRFQDETLAVVSGFWSDEDKVTVNIDSAYTTTDCFTNFTDTCECYQNTDCLSPKFCQKATGDCLGCGECASRPEACFDFWDPVCGCDGNTYSNECYAHASGVNVAYRGVCSE
ncbi:hypothetical protein JW877_02290 [bacterium]|nr:hypothetical protein [bacterium]